MKWSEYNYKLNRLEDRRNKGIITDTEYQVAKSKLYMEHYRTEFNKLKNKGGQKND